jgi:hypothetical protein
MDEEDLINNGYDYYENGNGHIFDDELYYLEIENEEKKII